MSDKQKIKLGKYGFVRTCKVIDNAIVTIVITGFSINAKNTFALMQDCIAMFPEYPVLETAVTDDDIAIIVLKRKKHEY